MCIMEYRFHSTGNEGNELLNMFASFIANGGHIVYIYINHVKFVFLLHVIMFRYFHL